MSMGQFMYFFSSLCAVFKLFNAHIPNRMFCRMEFLQVKEKTSPVNPGCGKVKLYQNIPINLTFSHGLTLSK